MVFSEKIEEMGHGKGERRKEKGEITMRDFKAPASFSFLLSHF
jgi:hypothetical protein